MTASPGPAEGNSEAGLAIETPPAYLSEWDPMPGLEVG